MASVDAFEETPPFSGRLRRLLDARYGSVARTEMVDYLLHPDRIEEAHRVEQYAWAFRVTETLKREGPAVGIGRIGSDDPPRLAETLKPKIFTRWGLPEMLACAELNDLLLAYGYDLGIGGEAEEAVGLDLDGMDRTRAWETIVAWCDADEADLTPLFSMESDLLPFVYDLAGRNASSAARHMGLRVGREFWTTVRLLVTAGLLMRAVQQEVGEYLWEMIPPYRLEAVRGVWPSPELAGTRR